MLLRLIIAGFILLMLVSNLKRIFQFAPLCPSSSKVVYLVWNILGISALLCFAGYFITLNKYFIYLFVLNFPISGFLLLLFPLQFSIAYRAISGKLPDDQLYTKVTSKISKIDPILSTMNQNKMLNHFNTIGYTRIMGLFLIIFGGIFFFSITNSFR